MLARKSLISVLIIQAYFWETLRFFILFIQRACSNSKAQIHPLMLFMRRSSIFYLKSSHYTRSRYHFGIETHGFLNKLSLCASWFGVTNFHLQFTTLYIYNPSLSDVPTLFHPHPNHFPFCFSAQHETLSNCVQREFEHYLQNFDSLLWVVYSKAFLTNLLSLAPPFKPFLLLSYTCLNASLYCCFADPDGSSDT